MKFLSTAVATLTVLLLAITLRGFALDAATVLSSGFTAGLAGCFVADYARPSRTRGPGAEAPVRRRATGRPSEPAPVFGSLVVFNTSIA